MRGFDIHALDKNENEDILKLNTIIVMPKKKYLRSANI